MMYREFIERTGYDERYMTYDDYANYIEPVYANGDDDKNKFCKKFVKQHSKYVYTAVELMISSKTTEEQVDYAFNNNDNIMADVEKAHNMLKKGFLKKLKEFYK